MTSTGYSVELPNSEESARRAADSFLALLVHHEGHGDPLSAAQWPTFVRDVLTFLLTQVPVAGGGGAVSSPDVEAQEGVWMSLGHPHRRLLRDPFIAMLFKVTKLTMQLMNHQKELPNLLAFEPHEIEQMVDSVTLVTFVLRLNPMLETDQQRLIHHLEARPGAVRVLERRVRSIPFLSIPAAGIIEALRDFLKYKQWVGMLIIFVRAAVTGLAMKAVLALQKMQLAHDIVEQMIRKATEQQEEKDANLERRLATNQRARMSTLFRKDDAQVPKAEAKAEIADSHNEKKQEEQKADIYGTVGTKERASEESKQPPTETTTVPVVWQGDLRSGHGGAVHLQGPEPAEGVLQMISSQGVAYAVHRQALSIDDCAHQMGTALQDTIVGLVAVQSGNTTQKKIEQLMYDALKPLEQWSLFFFSNNLILLPFAHVSLLASTSKGHR